MSVPHIDRNKNLVIGMSIKIIYCHMKSYINVNYDNDNLEFIMYM